MRERIIQGMAVVGLLLLCGCVRVDSVSVKADPITVSSRWVVENKDFTIPRFINNPLAKDVTYDELMTFVRRDKTDRIRFSGNESLNPCEFYAVTLHDNAEREGIRCGYVVITFKEIDEIYGRYGHALVLFKTVDRGPIFIDDATSLKDVVPPGQDIDYYSFDKIGEVVIGEPYVPRRLFNFDHILYKSMGTVEAVDTYWYEFK